MQHLLFLASALLPILLVNSGLTLASSATGYTFNPLAFSQHWNVANCPGVNRADNETVNLALRRFSHNPIRIRSTLNSIRAEYVDINPNAKRALLFLHGWPSLWASWKYQIQEFRVGGVLLFDNIWHFVMWLACRRITV